MEKQGGFKQMQWLRFSLISWMWVTIAFSANSAFNDSLNESFDPTSLSDWKVMPRTREVVRPIEEELEDRVANAPSTPEESKTVIGYRVQIFSTSDYLQAIKVDSIARTRWKEKVYMRFDSPYYKIRIGNALQRDAADRLQQEAMKAGYRTAWVVRTEIQRRNDE